MKKINIKKKSDREEKEIEVVETGKISPEPKEFYISSHGIESMYRAINWIIQGFCPYCYEKSFGPLKGEWVCANCGFSMPDIVVIKSLRFVGNQVTKDIDTVNKWAKSENIIVDRDEPEPDEPEPIEPIFLIEDEADIPEVPDFGPPTDDEPPIFSEWAEEDRVPSSEITKEATVKYMNSLVPVTSPKFTVVDVNHIFLGEGLKGVFQQLIDPVPEIHNKICKIFEGLQIDAWMHWIHKRTPIKCIHCETEMVLAWKDEHKEIAYWLHQMETECSADTLRWGFDTDKYLGALVDPDKEVAQGITVGQKIWKHIQENDHVYMKPEQDKSVTMIDTGKTKIRI